MTKHMETLAQENRDLIERMKNLAQDTSLVTRKLHELQQDTVDDSGIVMIITVASVIYLPGSFVGVSQINQLPISNQLPFLHRLLIM